jgi:nucleoid DNA-binding protein
VFVQPPNKTVIVKSVNNQLSLSKKECAEMVETLLDTLKSTFASGEDVLISDLYNLRCTERI